MARIPGKTFRIPGEGPDKGREVVVKSFWIDRHEVPVSEFARFVEATGYRTDAEKTGRSAMFDSAMGELKMEGGASWRSPEGPGSVARPDEPVCQVSYRDAEAYAKWAGKRLPTESEYELAAGGKSGARYWWGNDLNPSGRFMANYWQGTFPSKDTAEDGYSGRSPVCSFPRNDHGLCDIAGNVWEWTQDWFETRPGPPAPRREKVIKGGSWLCSETYSTGYRLGARGHAAVESAVNNLGFRCAKDD